MRPLDPNSKAKLLTWFRAHKRDLPWRRSRDPYAIWVSEIMLQQTQVATVIPFFTRWMERFPTVEALASAQEDEVLAVWQGLGYYRRCRMLIAGARHVSVNGFPSTASAWTRVPGIGRYTAGAIASIAQGLAAELVDGNVERVYARINADSASGTELSRRAWAWAESNLDATSPGDWNQALMELGATVCVPRSPRCPDCPVSSHCQGFKSGQPELFPTRVPKPQLVAVSHSAVIIRCGTRVGLERIPNGEWWEGLWRFPPAQVAEGVVREDASLRYVGTVNHVVTKHKVTLTVYVRDLPLEEDGVTWFEVETLDQIPLPTPQRRAWDLVHKAPPGLM